MIEPSSPSTSDAAPGQGLAKAEIGDAGPGAAELPRILLVDDQPARLLTYEAILSGLPASYVRALSGLDALRKLMEQDFAVILLDVSMPGMDGFETARMIRENRRFERTPIIFVTGVHFSDLDRLKGYEVGAIDYISVPIVPEILRSKVAVLLELFQRRSELEHLNGQLRAAREQLLDKHSTELAASDARGRAIFEHPTQLALVIEAERGPEGSICNWKCTEANERALVLLGLPRSKVIGSRPVEVFPDCSQNVPALYEQVLSSGELVQYEVSLGHRELLVQLFPIGRDALVASGIDITQSKHAAEALRVSEQRFRTLFIAAGVGMILMDDQCRMLTVNPAFCAIVGRDSAEFIRKSLFIFVHPDDAEVQRREIKRLLRKEVPSTVFDARYFLETGVRKWVRIHVSLLPELRKAGQTDRLLAVVEDISERVTARHELEQLSRERQELLEAERAARSEAESAAQVKDDFLANLSHELRTPMANVISWARVLQRKYADTADAGLIRGLNIIVDNAMVQSELISDLLDMSRIVAGKISLESKSVELCQLLRDAADTQRLAAEAKGLELVFSSDTDVALVLADPVRLKQAIGNLLSNAIKFTPSRGGQIVVRLETVGNGYEIAVQDPGEGIDPSFLAHIFERFRQADHGSSRRHGGLGLGLAIVKQLVELHGGSVSASSPGRGKGATFLMRLPAQVAEVHRPLSGEAAAPTDLAFLSRLRVLVVEDHPAMLEHLRLVLEEHGAAVTTAATAAEALDLIRVDPRAVQVLISDLGLPGQDGYQLIREIRTGLRLTAAELPALALTAFARDEDRARALGQGYQAYMTKPYAVNQLLATLRNLVG